MNGRRFTVIPVASTIVLLGLHLLLTPSAHWGRGLDIVSLVAKMAACIGAFLAARSFERGDYMRRAFTLHTLTFACLVIRDCFALVPPLRGALESAHVYDLVWRILFVTANISGVSAAFMMAHAARLTLFDAEAFPYRGVIGLGMALLLGLVLTGPSIVLAATELRAGQLHNFIILIGSIADLLAFVLTVPIVRLALALRGGLLYIPWTLIASARIFWLVRDCFGAAPASWWQEAEFLLVAEAARTLACTCDFAAGVAFWRVFNAPEDSSAE